MLLDRDAADRMFFEMKVVAVSVRDFAQHSHRLFDYFRSHPVTGQDDNS